MTLRVIEWFTFAGTSFAARYPVVWARLAGLDAPDTGRLERARRIFHDALGDDAAGLSLSETDPGRLLAELGLRLLQASRHPVTRTGAVRNADGTVEITVEAVRDGIGARLLELLAAFWQDLHDGGAARSFASAYAEHRDRLTFRLGELLRGDRAEMARALGLSARSDGGSRLWVGQGAGRRLVSGGYLGRTGFLAADLAGNKARCAQILLQNGLPAPDQRSAQSEAEAIAAAEAIGYPVVVKPRDGSKGRGVMVNLASAEEVAAGYREAARLQRTVVVERYVPGDDYRLLVAAGRFLAAVKRVPAAVVGDGKHTVEELIALINVRQRRTGLYLYPIKVDGDIHRMLAAQGLRLEDIPATGRDIRLRGAANQSLGGTTVDVTAIVHADNRAAAVLAAQALQVDAAGIDFVTTDITRSWRDGIGGIVEINAGPGVDLHLAPTVGQVQAISWGMLRNDFSPTERYDQRSIAVVGQWYKRDVAQACATMARRVGLFPALVLRDALHRPGRQVEHRAKDLAGRHNAAAFDGEVECVIGEWRTGELVAEGAPLAAVDVAILTDDRPRPDLDAVAPDLLARLARMTADLATTAVVFDARHAGLWDAVAALPPPAVRVVWPDAAQALPDRVMEHLRRGGWAVQAGKAEVHLRHGPDRTWSFACSGHWAARKPESMSHRLAALAAQSAITPDPEALRAAWRGLSDREDDLLATWLGDQSGRWLACADPRDPAVARELAAWPADRTLWVVAGGPGEPPLPEALRERLDGRHRLVGIGQDARSLEQAVAWIEGAASESDGLLILLADEPERLRMFRALRAAAPPPDRLESLFNGRWARGAWARGQPPEGVFAVIPGRFQDKADQAGILVALHDAFRQGCRGAIASGLSDELPCWWPVLVSDDPLAGWHRSRRAAPELPLRLWRPAG